MTLTRPGKHICPYCQRQCSKPSVLEKHIRAHTGERPYPCLVCGFSFKTKSNLYKHCKSRAHIHKSNLELKKSQGTVEAAGASRDYVAEILPAPIRSDTEKRTQTEPVQRHVIQEVVKYLEKDKGQRPNEVQTERQRAKLERLKSLHEKESSDTKRRENIQRQLSLPILPSSLSAPAVTPDEEGSVKNIAKILIPGGLIINDKGQIIQAVASSSGVVPQSSVSAAGDAGHPNHSNQIQVINLPDPDADPDTTTKALHDLEELSEKFSKASKDGVELATSVRSLPDKRVQVILELKPGSSRNMTETQNESAVASSQYLPVARNVLNSALKERIQHLISTNEAIIDTPKLDPPRAKCLRRNMSRQESDTSVKNEMEAAVSSLVMSNMNTAPLQPLQEVPKPSLQRHKSVIVENIETVPSNNVVVFDEMHAEQSVTISCDDSHKTQSDIPSPLFYRGPDGKLTKLELKPSPTRVSPESGLGLSGKGSMASKTRPGFELPLTTTFLPVTSTPVLAAHLSRTQPLPSIFSPKLSTKSNSISSLPLAISAPNSVNKITPSVQTPGQLGKMALKNLQIRSKSLSSSQLSPSPLTPVITPVLTPSVTTVTTPVMTSISTPVVTSVVFAMVGSQPQYVLQMPVQTATTPAIPVAQVLLPGSSVPTLLLGESPSPSTPKLPLQQTVILKNSGTSNVASRPVLSSVKTPTHILPASAPAPRFVLQPGPQTPTAVAPQVLPTSMFPLKTEPSKAEMRMTSIPVSGSGKLSDPMKILSSIVSSTLKPDKNEGPGSKAKEIKIEIKFPLPVTTGAVSAANTASVVTKSRPKILKRQHSVSMATPPVPSLSPAASGKPVFRFEAPLTTPTTPSPVTVVTPVIVSSGLTLYSVPSATVSQDKHVPSFPSLKSPETPVTSSGLVEVKLIQNHATFSLTQSPLPVAVVKNVSTSTYSCPYCGTGFKKEATLELHMDYYCKCKIPKVEVDNSDSKRYEPTKDSDTPVAKGSTNDSVKVDRLHSLSSKTFDETLSSKMSSGKGKELHSKLREQILKRKLKGRLLMMRSLSVDSLKQPLKSKRNVAETYKKEIPLSKTALKSEKNVYMGRVPVKRPRLVRSVDDSVANGVHIQRPVFKRSESVPSTSKSIDKLVDTEQDSTEGQEDEELAKSEDQKVGKVNLKLSVPVVTAHIVISDQSPTKPIYQQNFRMKMFDGMGTPVQLLPSATLTPRPELMEIEKVKRMFTFDANTLKLVPKSNAEDILKSPLLSSPKGDDVVDIDGKNLKSPTPKQKTIAEGVSSPAAKKSPFLRQFSLVSHSYPSMRSMTHLSFCTKDRLQPSYVKANKKISMYSNWRVAQQSNNPLGLATKALLSLYNSRYSTNPVWVVNSGINPRQSLITHSSYWTEKHGEDKKSCMSVLPLEYFKQTEKEKKKLHGGYKSTESYVYVRGRGRGKYVCETCGIRCRKPSMLKKHIRTHTNLRPFKCKQCKFSFKTKGNLTKHMKSKSHVRKCVNLGISPIPTTVDETQIDTSVLAAQCSISKQAKIVDEMERSLEESDMDVMDADEGEEEEGMEDEDDGAEDLSDDDAVMMDTGTNGEGAGVDAKTVDDETPLAELAER